MVDPREAEVEQPTALVERIGRDVGEQLVDGRVDGVSHPQPHARI